MLSGCKSTPEKEEQKWTETQAQVEESLRMYPKMQDALKANQATATQMWEAAKALSDDAAKMEAMKAANERADLILRPLQLLEMKLDSIQRDIDHISRKRLKGTAILQRERALDSLNRDIDRERRSLQEVSLTDPQQLADLLDQMWTRVNGLSNRSSQLRSHLSKVKRSQTQKRIEREAQREAPKAPRLVPKPTRTPVNQPPKPQSK